MKTIVVGVKVEVDSSRLIDALTEIVGDAPWSIHLANMVVVGAGDDQRDRRDLAQRTLDDLASPLRRAGHEVETHVSFAALSSGSHLAELADELQADLLVIGLAKRTRVGKALLGSDSQTAIMQASCPVLSVRLAD